MTNERDAGIRQQLKAIGADRERLVRDMETVQGQVKTKDGGRGYDIPAPTWAQTERMRELGAKIAECDQAISALNGLA